jgi:hypothetical protein
LTLRGDSLLIGWSDSSGVPGFGTRRAIRIAVLEMLTAAGLHARYEPPAERPTGTIAVTVPHPTDHELSTPE